MAVAAEPDRFGIGWRQPLAAGIFANLAAIDALEVIAENCVGARLRERRSLRALGREVPLLLHGVGLGPASVSAVDEDWLGDIARVAGTLEPCAWSEHLCFVRSGGIEIGHLAAPPRNQATVDGAVRNLRRLRQIVGMAPAMENIATLMQPPASTMDEPEWVSAITTATGTPLLLDLHNLYANAVNFGYEPLAYLSRFPLRQVAIVHISGGVPIDLTGAAGESRVTRVLDDHLHDVPDPVYDLLEALGTRCPQSLTIILERDGRFPPMAALLGQLERARAALASGRAQRAASAADPA